MIVHGVAARSTALTLFSVRADDLHSCLECVGDQRRALGCDQSRGDVRIAESQRRRRQPPPHTRPFRIWWNRIGGLVFVGIGITLIVLVVLGIMPPR